MRNIAAQRVDRLKRTAKRCGIAWRTSARARARCCRRDPAGGERLPRLVRKYPLPVGVGAIVLGFVAGFAFF
jgi:hypothetical protein